MTICDIRKLCASLDLMEAMLSLNYRLSLPHDLPQPWLNLTARLKEEPPSVDTWDIRYTVYAAGENLDVLCQSLRRQTEAKRKALAEEALNKADRAKADETVEQVVAACETDAKAVGTS